MKLILSSKVQLSSHSQTYIVKSQCSVTMSTSHRWRRLPLEALLLLPLLTYLGELPFIILPRPALLGFASGVVFHALHLLLPRLHQLVVALADLLFLCTQHGKCYIRSGRPSLLQEPKELLANGISQKIHMEYVYIYITYYKDADIFILPMPPAFIL